jgi:hypothetical protein
MKGSSPMSDLFASRVELKFTIDPVQASEIRHWSLERMSRDECNPNPHVDHYDIVSLYLDTPNFSVFHRDEDAPKCKHRLRRYGNDSLLWLETKRKKKDIVNKQRSSINVDAIDTLAQLEYPKSSELGGVAQQVESANDSSWFHDRVSKFQLRPSTLISYRRFARVFNVAGQLLRLTMDSDIRSTPANSWYVPDRLDQSSVCLTELETLELKFENALPPMYRELMQTFNLVRSKFSKYRSSVIATGRHLSVGLVA